MATAQNLLEACGLGPKGHSCLATINSAAVRLPAVSATTKSSDCTVPYPTAPDNNPDKGSTPLPSESEPAKAKRRPMSHALNENFGTDELMEELRDRKAFGKRGELVLVAQLVCIVLVMFPPMRLQGVVYLAGILAMLSGAIACLFACVSLGRSFSPLVAPRNQNELVTSGMYQYMRHPFYAGLISIAYGLAAVTYNETRLVLALLLFLVLNYKAKQEEAALLERHGDAYNDYGKRVARFFPTL